MIYSFNASKLVTVWGGWSAKWYSTLLEHEQILDALGAWFLARRSEKRQRLQMQ